MLVEVIHEVRLSFKKKVMECLNNWFFKHVLLQIFYCELDEVNEGVVNNLDGGSFLKFTYPQANIFLNQMVKINMAWHMRDRLKDVSVVT